jgi:hypothetical protein
MTISVSHRITVPMSLFVTPRGLTAFAVAALSVAKVKNMLRAATSRQQISHCKQTNKY